MRLFLKTLLVAVFAGSLPSIGAAQGVKNGHSAIGASPFAHGIELAESGHCKQAVPLLLKLARKATDPDLARRIGFDGLACARALNEDRATVEFVLFLNRRFPRDPDVLYVTTHAYSDLSLQASEELLAIAPASLQAMLLDAESLEVQQRWAEAKEEYSRILQKYPQTGGIHLRIARIDLSETPSARTVADAKLQLEEELKADPRDAAAEDLLGGIALKSEQWDQAIAHFSRASRLDAGLTDAFLGLGMALNSAGRFSEAITPLVLAENRLPNNATVHYQLLLAYSRLGRKQDAAREMVLFRQASQRAANREKRQVQGTPQGQPPK